MFFGRKTIIKNVMEPAAMFLKANNLSSVMIISQDKKRQNDSYIQQNLCTMYARCAFLMSQALCYISANTCNFPSFVIENFHPPCNSH